jgi:hypothetical protein
MPWLNHVGLADAYNETAEAFDIKNNSAIKTAGERVASLCHVLLVS